MLGLSNCVRTQLALQAKPLIEEEARARQGERTDFRQKSDEGEKPIRIDEAVAALADVSRDTVRKVENIEQHATTRITVFNPRFFTLFSYNQEKSTEQLR